MSRAYRWVLRSSLPTSYQHRARLTPAGDISHTTLCGVIATANRYGRRRWYMSSVEPIANTKRCSNCQLAA